MFISVDLPAPFSPSRQWISPGSMVRSMWSLAVNDPNFLVRPLISSFIAVPPRSHHRAEPGRRNAPAPALPTQCRALSVGSARRDGDRTVDDALLELVDLVLQVLRDLAVEVVVRSQAHTTVLQRAGEELVAERALERLLDRLGHRDVHALDHRGQQDVA